MYKSRILGTESIGDFCFVSQGIFLLGKKKERERKRQWGQRMREFVFFSKGTMKRNWIMVCSNCGRTKHSYCTELVNFWMPCLELYFRFYVFAMFVQAVLCSRHRTIFLKEELQWSHIFSVRYADLGQKFILRARAEGPFYGPTSDSAPALLLLLLPIHSSSSLSSWYFYMPDFIWCSS